MAVVLPWSTSTTPLLWWLAVAVAVLLMETAEIRPLVVPVVPVAAHMVRMERICLTPVLHFTVLLPQPEGGDHHHRAVMAGLHRDRPNTNVLVKAEPILPGALPMAFGGIATLIVTIHGTPVEDSQTAAAVVAVLAITAVVAQGSYGLIALLAVVAAPLLVRALWVPIRRQAAHGKARVTRMDQVQALAAIGAIPILHRLHTVPMAALNSIGRVGLT
jgi:hypothetical protein